MTDEEVDKAIQAKNWREIWIAAISGGITVTGERLVQESNAPDWLKNLFGSSHKLRPKP